MHIGFTSHLWLKSASYASSHPCMCTCVLRLDCFLLACLVFYFVPPFSFQPFLMFTSALNERSRSNPLCDFRLGTVVTSDYETPLTFGRTNIFPGSCILGMYSKKMRNKQRYCGQLQNHVRIANFCGWKKEITIPSKS